MPEAAYLLIATVAVIVTPGFLFPEAADIVRWANSFLFMGEGGRRHKVRGRVANTPALSRIWEFPSSSSLLARYTHLPPLTPSPVTRVEEMRNTVRTKMLFGHMLL